jgi:hypothetical protein
MNKIFPLALLLAMVISSIACVPVRDERNPTASDASATDPNEQKALEAWMAECAGKQVCKLNTPVFARTLSSKDTVPHWASSLPGRPKRPLTIFVGYHAKECVSGEKISAGGSVPGDRRMVGIVFADPKWEKLYVQANGDQAGPQANGRSIPPGHSMDDVGQTLNNLSKEKSEQVLKDIMAKKLYADRGLGAAIASADWHGRGLGSWKMPDGSSKHYIAHQSIGALVAEDGSREPCRILLYTYPLGYFIAITSPSNKDVPDGGGAPKLALLSLSSAAGGGVYCFVDPYICFHVGKY